jgi:hypothetical protein
MTVPTDSNRAGPFATNGATTVFPFSFPITAAEDLKVYRLDTVTSQEVLLTLTTDYSVSFTAGTAGGSITSATTLPSGYEVTILREVEITQELDLDNSGGWFPDAHEAAYDKLTMAAQQLDERVGRALRVPASFGGVLELPVPRAGYLLGSTDGESFTNIETVSASDAIAGNWVVDRFLSGVSFTGGVTTALTLSEAPASAQSILVTFDGVVQHRATYGVSTLYLILTSPIPVGVAEVEVRIPKTLPTGVPDGNIVATGTDTPRRLSERFADVVNVKDFGAKGDGVTDDTASIQNAASVVNGRATGAVLYFPAGRYVVSGTFAVTSNFSVVRGAGPRLSTLVRSGNGTFVTIGSGAVGTSNAGIEDIGFEVVGTPSNGHYAIACEGLARGFINNIHLENGGGGVIFTGSTVGCNLVFCDNFSSAMANVGGYVFDIHRAAGIYINDADCIASGTGSSGTSSAIGGGGISVQNDHLDTLVVSNSIFQRFYQGAVISAAGGKVLQNIWFNQNIFDFTRNQSVYMAANGVGSLVLRVHVTGCWLTASLNHAVETVAVSSGAVQLLQFGQSRVLLAGLCGIELGAGVTQVLVSGCQITSCNGLALGTPAIRLNGADDVTISGNTLGDVDIALPTYTATHGVTVASDVTKYSITGNRLVGTTSGFSAVAHAAGSKNRIVANNIGFQPVGPVALTLPASTVAYTNVLPYWLSVHIHGGTVSGIAKNGTNISGMSSGHLRIGPGETFAVTYSSAPSVTAFAD